MKRRLNRVSACKALLCLMAFGLASPTVTAAPVISATKKDAISNDVNSNTMANPGDTLKYTVTIKNTGDMSGTGAQFTDTLDPNTTLVPGSVTATPIAANDNYTISGNTNLDSMFITPSNGLLLNDSDPDGGRVSATVQNGAPTAKGGTVNVHADGSFEYFPAAGNSMTDTFTYTITDNEGMTDTGTASIMFPEVIWYVDSSKPNGNGTSGSPFNNLADAANASLAGHMIFVLTGSGVTGPNTGITLNNNESLVGQGVDLVVTFNGTPKTLYPAGPAPVIGTPVTLAQNNTIKGLNIGNSGNPVVGTGITGSSYGTLTVSDLVGVTTSGGPALNLATGTLNNASFASLSSTNSSGRGLSITGSAGTLSVTNPTVIGGIPGPATEGLFLGTNTGTFNFAGLNITNTGNTGFFASSGGTVNVTGTANTIATTTGTALNLTSTTIGASGITFRSISASGGPNGIVLNNTGTSGSGGFAVTGVGTAGSGGTIQNTTTRGASFISTRNISLTNMNFTNAATLDFPAAPTGLSLGNNTADNAAIHLETVFTATLNGIVINGSAEQGINGHNVKDFTLQSSSITNAGNGPDEDGIHFYNMLGTSSITNTTISSSGDDNINIQNNTNLALPAGMTAVLNLAITNGSANTGVLGSGYLMGIRGTSTATVTIDGVTANNNFSGGVVIDTFDTATSTIEVKNSTSTNNNDGISLSSNNGSTKFDIHDNVSFAGNDFVRINILKAAFSTGGTLQGKIRNNPIVVTDGQTTDAISIFNAGAGTLAVSITGNTITYRGTQRAINLQTGQDGAGALHVTATNNNIDVQLDGTGNAVNGILANSGVADPSGAGSFLCADIGGAGALSNTFTHSLGGSLAGGDIRVRQRFSNNVQLPGYGGGATDTTAVGAYLDGRNAEVSPSTASFLTGSFVGGGACTQPVFP